MGKITALTCTVSAVCYFLSELEIVEFLGDSGRHLYLPRSILLLSVTYPLALTLTPELQR